MYETRDIYIEFRRAQGNSSSRPYRIPKDFDKHLNEKMSKKNRDALLLATKFFNTKWMNVDPYRFFECGFELYKRFTYIQFFDQRVMSLYQVKDKNLKREMRVNKDNILQSAKWIMEWMTNAGYESSSIESYCKLRNNKSSIPIEHYLQGKIDKYFIVYLLSRGLLRLTDGDRALIPYIVDQYRECLSKLKEMKIL